jgi:hypothetical protein
MAGLAGLAGAVAVQDVSGTRCFIREEGCHFLFVGLHILQAVCEFKFCASWIKVDNHRYINFERVCSFCPLGWSENLCLRPGVSKSCFVRAA